MSFVHRKPDLERSKALSRAAADILTEEPNPLIVVDAIYNLFSSFVGACGEVGAFSEEDIIDLNDEFHRLVIDRLTAEGVLAPKAVH
jgi:hypothetical protein